MVALKRRQLLKYAALVSAFAGGGTWLVADFPVTFEPAEQLKLKASEQQIFWWFIPAFLDGVIEPQDSQAKRALLQRIDQAFQGLSPATQAELRQLLELLASRAGWLLLSAGLTPLSELSLQQRLLLLEQWQQHYLQLLRQAYQGLHEIIYAAWYGDPTTWPAISYQLPAAAKVLFDDQ